MSDKKFTVDKKTGGWWFVREILIAFGTSRTKEQAIAECHERNESRLESKKISFRMAKKEYLEATTTFPMDPKVVYARCQKAEIPKGWWCSRDAEHEGPCAARQYKEEVCLKCESKRCTCDGQ